MSLIACADPAVLAAVHRRAFDDAWTQDAFAELLTGPGVFALAASDNGAVEGFILCRAIVGEAEVLTIAVAPAHRRRGVGRSLLQGALDEARRLGAAAMFLEVAEDNIPALTLYRSAGFAQVGLRRGYYAPGAIDALVLRLDLNTPPAADYVSAGPRRD